MENVENTKLVSLDDLVLEGNPRSMDTADQKTLQALADDIHARIQRGLTGLRYPIRANFVKNSDGETRLVIEDGQRRYKACLLLRDRGIKIEKVPVIIEENAPLDALYDALADNIHREDLSSYDIAVALQQLRERGEAAKDIAQRLKMSPPYVSLRTVSFERTTDEVKRHWKAGKLPIDVVFEISKKPKEEQNAATEKYIKAAASDGKRGKGKARVAVKHAVEWASRQEIKELLQNVEDAPNKLRYVAGLRDALKFVTGDIGWAEFAEEYNKHIKEKNNE